jgi:DMSO/TMAO reductase YedYZ molybdopterin-dependent catalytic subunit
MITRRRVVAGSTGALLLASVAGKRAFGAATTAAEPLIALPGKQPLIRRTFRPPNYETPLAQLRPQITANDTFFVRYHLASIPEADARTWRLRIGGASAQRTLELSLDELKRDFERVAVVAVNQCSGNRRGLFTPRAAGVQWSYGAMGNALWGGVRLRDVLDRVGVKGDALEVVFDGADQAALPGTPDFVKSLPVDRARDEHTLIAFEMNGEPLPHWHGAPARLVAAGWTATYWVKHLTSISVEPKAFDGFWMKSAYRIPTGVFPGARFASQENAATTPITEILINSLITSHVDGDRLQRGRPAELAGWAWDGGSGIGAVELSTDEGRSWRSMTLGEAPSSYSWRGFRAALDTSKSGPLRVAVRATGRNGATQPEKLTANPAGYHHNIIQTLTLEVA